MISKKGGVVRLRFFWEKYYCHHEGHKVEKFLSRDFRSESTTFMQCEHSRSRLNSSQTAHVLFYGFWIAGIGEDAYS